MGSSPTSAPSVPLHSAYTSMQTNVGQPGDLQSALGSSEMIREYQKTVLDAAIQHNPRNIPAALQAAQLLTSGAVTYDGDYVEFHTINGVACNEYINTKPLGLKFVSEEYIKVRDSGYKDYFGNTRMENKNRHEDRKGERLLQTYLDDETNRSRIQSQLGETHEYPAGGTFKKIYNALEGDEYTRWRTIQLLTDIYDAIILDMERSESGDSDGPTRTFAIIGRGSAGTYNYSRENAGSIYAAGMLD